jgi:cell division protein FtsI/penicillin-binding protein 2
VKIKSHKMKVMMPLFLSTITVVLLFSNIGYYISYIRVKRKLKALKEKNQQIKNINISLERDICDQANKNIILESLLKQRPNQNEDRKIY